MTRFWKEHDETESQNSCKFSNELAGLNSWVLSQSESLNSQCTRCANVFSHLINIIDQADKQISVVVTTIKKLIDEKNDKSHACYLHRKKLAATAELQVRLLQSDAVDSHLQIYWNNWFWILKLKTDSATWWWFWATNCSSQSADNMRVYNYLHHDLFLMIEVDTLLNWIHFKSEVWKRDDSVIILNVFSWLYEFNSSLFSLSIIINEKFQMYHHHLWEVEERQNYDWLQNMFYDIIQQVICQSSAYYLIYVVLHSDHNYYLISYSYYSKFQAAFNKTFFRYINLNILKLVNERKEQYIIQGSVSLNNEKKEDCTEMLLEMHHHLGEWWKNV